MFREYNIDTAIDNMLFLELQDMENKDFLSDMFLLEAYQKLPSQEYWYLEELYG